MGPPLGGMPPGCPQPIAGYAPTTQPSSSEGGAGLCGPMHGGPPGAVSGYDMPGGGAMPPGMVRHRRPKRAEALARLPEPCELSLSLASSRLLPL